ncbi:C6 zinc finger domain protein [Metarhizium album ARSEF 1941]|uniref:C6 zinc finger domain protein n=1 Tax=Metarhizium album (strain ARSEF 1941) TaxID=1081103 RepID=A0A0B2WLU5_METAS|nr:C6 zinc finger domain protein [Metarhizium album ARSEF 1941]KHN94457.1 C6 zinc finger domain protein [Metarhizium album ARSEF 1941]
MNGIKRSWKDVDDTDAAAAMGSSFTATLGRPSLDDSSVTITTDGTRLDDKASAASRQKSCNACVRGKRRCDKRTPRNCPPRPVSPLPCPSSSATESARPPGSVPSSRPISAGTAGTAGTASVPTCAGVPAVSSSSAASTASGVSDVPDFDMSFDMDSLGTDTSPENLQADAGVPLGASAYGSGGLDFSIVDLMAQTAGREDDIWNLHSFAETTTDKLHVPPVPSGHSTIAPFPVLHQDLQQRQPIRDLSLIKDVDTVCMEIDPLSVHDPSTRIGYTVRFLTSMHSTFAQTRALPFMHPRLWVGQLPKVILAAFSASSAYAACTSSNKGWTVRLLVDVGREIHREGERAVSSEDKLSRVQALLILNSMRIFDGDLGLRAAAEREVPVLMSWLKELNSIRKNLETDETHGGANAFVREKPPKSWELDILGELPPHIDNLVRLSDDDMWCDDFNFTASRHLWDAPNSVEFYRAWREKPQFLIHNMGFKDFWMYARPDDCDEFTRLMLTTQVGTDAMAHFMNGDGAIPVIPGRAP